MHCIFCKSDSSDSISIEHIIPESLGNTKHALLPGVVCDRCNNYFSREVEKPLLDSGYFVQARFRNILPSKKGRIPPIEGVLGPMGAALGLCRDKDGQVSLYAIDDRSERIWIEYLKSHSSGQLIIPVPSAVESFIVSRFLAKVALEVLAERVMSVPGWDKEVVFKPELDEIRNFARVGDQRKQPWPFHERRLYAEQTKITPETGEPYEVLHEYNLLYTPQRELYLVVVILGVEYAINLGGREIEGYLRWLEEHGNRSHLYPDGTSSPESA